MLLQFPPYLFPSRLQYLWSNPSCPDALKQKPDNRCAGNLRLDIELHRVSCRHFGRPGISHDAIKLAIDVLVHARNDFGVDRQLLGLTVVPSHFIAPSKKATPIPVLRIPDIVARDPVVVERCLRSPRQSCAKPDRDPISAGSRITLSRAELIAHEIVRSAPPPKLIPSKGRKIVLRSRKPCMSAPPSRTAAPALACEPDDAI